MSDNASQNNSRLPFFPASIIFSYSGAQVMERFTSQYHKVPENATNSMLAWAAARAFSSRPWIRVLRVASIQTNAFTEKIQQNAKAVTKPPQITHLMILVNSWRDSIDPKMCRAIYPNNAHVQSGDRYKATVFVLTGINQ